MLRIATEQDVPEILAIYAPYILHTTVTFEYTVPSQEEFLARFRSVTQRFPWLLWEESGKILGYTYASAPFSRAAYNWCAEPSIYLLPDVQGRGIGTQLYLALEKILKLQGFQILYALITDGNAASLAFHHARGYQNLAFFPDCGLKFGKWLGLHWLEKRLSSVEIPTSFPVLWSEIVNNQQKLGNIFAILSIFESKKI